MCPGRREEKVLFQLARAWRGPRISDAAPSAIQAFVTSTGTSQITQRAAVPAPRTASHAAIPTETDAAMTDSPAVRIPLDPQEQPILDQLLGIRTQLELLRADKSTYVKSEDVIRLYNSIIDQVERLNKIRTHKRLEQNRGLSRAPLASRNPPEPTRRLPLPFPLNGHATAFERIPKLMTNLNVVDTVLDDCFQLISLAYMAIGKNHEAPATYSAVSTMKVVSRPFHAWVDADADQRLLDHLYEAAFFSPKDLDSVESRLKEYRTSVERGKETYSPSLITLLEARMDICQELLEKLKHTLEKLSPELKPIYEKLVSILRSLSACNTRSKVSSFRNKP